MTDKTGDAGPALAGVGNRLREAIARAAERVVLEADTRHAFVGPRRAGYHPVASLGMRGTRGEAVSSRFSAIGAALGSAGVSPGVLVDVGAAEGYYSVRFARRGWTVWAVEGMPRHARVLRAVARRVRIPGVGRVVPVEMRVTPRNASVLPHGDAVLVMAVWHWWVRDYGLDAATRILVDVWDRTRGALVFETGEREMDKRCGGLPFPVGGDVDAWVRAYLERTCRGGRVEFLGRHSVNPAGARVPGATRGLWIVWGDI